MPKYFTHDKSYCPVQQTRMEFVNINFMQPLLSEEIISPDTETAVKELVEEYRPVRQRTVRGETTEDEAWALPLAVYSREQDCNRVDLMEGLGNALCTEEPRVFTMHEEEKEEDIFVHGTSEGGNAPQVTSVEDCLVAVQWQLLKRDPRKMNMKPTQEMAFLIERTKILHLLPFQDLGCQYVPIFGLICKVRL